MKAKTRLTMLAKFPGRCPLCRKPIDAGTRIALLKGTGWCHGKCAPDTADGTVTVRRVEPGSIPRTRKTP